MALSRGLMSAARLCRGLRFSTQSSAMLQETPDSSKPRLLSEAEIERRRVRPSVTPEAMEVAGCLRRAGNDATKKESVLRTRCSRLLKRDLISLLYILQKQEEVETAAKVFDIIRKEIWYKPHLVLYLDMIYCYCGAEQKQYDQVLKLIDEVEQEGLVPLKSMFTVPMRQCVLQGDFLTCMKFYNRMNSSTCNKDCGYYKYLVKQFRQAGLVEEAEKIRADFVEVYKSLKPRTVYED